MTPEEKDLINQIRSQDAAIKSREQAIGRLGEILEETFILDLLPSKAVILSLQAIAADTSMPASLKKKATSLLKSYKI